MKGEIKEHGNNGYRRRRRQRNKSESTKQILAEIVQKGEWTTKRNRPGRCRESGRCSNNSTSRLGSVFCPSHSPGSRLLFFKGSWPGPRHLTGSCSHRAPIQTCAAPSNRCMGDGLGWGLRYKGGTALRWGPEGLGGQSCGVERWGGEPDGLDSRGRQEERKAWKRWMRARSSKKERTGVCVMWYKAPFLLYRTHTPCLLLAYSTGRTGTHWNYPWRRCQRHTYTNTQRRHTQQTD